MQYRLWIDDEALTPHMMDFRYPPKDEHLTGEPWVIATSVEEAIENLKERGMPTFLGLDHDLGNGPNVMQFLNWLANTFWDGKMPIPEYSVHSMNPCGRKNITAFMNSWKTSSEVISFTKTWAL